MTLASIATGTLHPLFNPSCILHPQAPEQLLRQLSKLAPI
jgi:hypothetical protein